MTWANTIDSSLLRAWTNVDKDRTVTDPQLSEFLILRPQKSTSIFQTESSNKRPAQTLIFFITLVAFGTRVATFRCQTEQKRVSP